MVSPPKRQCLMCRRTLKRKACGDRQETSTDFALRKFCGPGCYRAYGNAEALAGGRIVERSKKLKQQAVEIVKEREKKKRAARKCLPDEAGVKVYRVPPGHGGHD